ncbi:MAG: protein-L-isoaspartate(D-aspartate) O-methyltransferase [Planctomycetales bacterium]|nr:protein-L-isoaspartate(D-aspartate) O-methyltransferase [Planctomycetales bacterium]
MDRAKWRVVRWWLAGISALWLIGGTPSRGQDKDKFLDARLKMVEDEVAREGVKSKAVLAAMRIVPRHLFCLPQYRVSAYFDQALPIGFKQTISPPFIVAYMTESLDPQPTDKVLEIGTGSGYQAAVLSQIVAEVYTIEIVPELGKRAAQTLTDVGYRNVHAKVGDGYKGWPEVAPFDKIIVTCSPEDVPQPLIDQLKEGGRMIVPIGERYQQTFYLFEKRKGELVKTKLLPTMFVPMTGISEQQRKVLPDPTRPQILNGGFEIDEDQDGAADFWYYQRQLRRRIGGAPEGLAFIDFQCSEAGRGAQMLQAIGIEGSRVSGLEMSVMVKADGLKYGDKSYERPSLIVHYFDGDRKLVGEEHLGPWQGTFGWRKVTGTLSVPPKAKEGVLRVGLHGATGRLSVDDLRMTAVPR